MLDSTKRVITLEDQKRNAKILGLGLGAGALTLAVTEQPAEASVADVAAEVASLAGLAAAALAVALVPFGLFFAFKIVRKVMAGA